MSQQNIISVQAKNIFNMKIYLISCLSLMSLLTDQHLIPKLSTATSGKKGIPDGAIIIDLAESPERTSLPKSTYIVHPSTESSLFAHDEQWKLQRLETSEMQAEIAALTLFELSRPTSSANHHKAHHRDPETSDGNLLPPKKRFRTFTFDKNHLERQNEKNIIQDSTPIPISPTQDKHPTENMVPKEPHSTSSPEGNLREFNKEQIENSGFVHPMVDLTESREMKGDTSIRGASAQIATPLAFEHLKRVKKDAESDTNTIIESAHDLINYINERNSYPKLLKKQHILKSDIFEMSVQIADKLLFHHGKPIADSMTETLKQLRLIAESQAKHETDGGRAKYRRTITKSILAFTVLSISLMNEKEEEMDRVIHVILKELESLYNDIENDQHNAINKSRSWRSLSESFNDDNQRGREANLRAPTKKMGLAWQIVSLLMQEKAPRQLIQNPEDLPLFDNQRLTQAINKIILFSQFTPPPKVHHQAP
jgi:hypothetical protein